MKSSTQGLEPGQLPPELDFFKYAKAAPSGSASESAAPVKPTKAKENAESTQGKKRKRGDEERSE